MKPLKRVFFIVMISVFFLLSCTKSKEVKLENSWRLIRVKIDSTANWYESWQFQNKKLMILKEQGLGLPLDTVCTADYKLESGLSKTTLEMENCKGKPEYNGLWRVIKINKEILVILNKSEGVFIYREFVKE